jgi:hypothetical protein
VGPFCEHVKEFGTAKDDRRLSDERGNVIAVLSSALAFRPYDLRHTGVSQ